MPPPSLVLPDIAGLPAVECCCPRRLHCEGCGAVSFVLCWHPEMADRIGLSLVRFLFCFFLVDWVGVCWHGRNKKQNLTNTKGHRHSLWKHNVRVTTRQTQFHCTTLSNHLGPREDPPRITRTEMHRFFWELATAPLGDDQGRPHGTHFHYQRSTIGMHFDSDVVRMSMATSANSLEKLRDRILKQRIRPSPEVLLEPRGFRLRNRRSNTQIKTTESGISGCENAARPGIG